MLQIYCRGQPPDYVLRDAKNSSKFFKCVGSLQNVESSESSKSGRSLYQALTVEEYESVSLVCYRFQLLGLLSKMNNLASHQFFFFFLFLVPFFEYYMTINHHISVSCSERIEEAINWKRIF